MSVEADYILGTISIGIGATLVIELWNLFLKRTFSIPSLVFVFHVRFGPHVANSRGAYDQTFERQLVGDALLPKGGMLE